MPLVKIHVEDAVWRERRASLEAALKPIRAMLCEVFKVEPAICQLLLVPVHGIDDQTPVAADIQILPKPDRTAEVIRHGCRLLRDMLAEAAGRPAVIRASQLDPDAYMAVR